MDRDEAARRLERLINGELDALEIALNERQFDDAQVQLSDTLMALREIIRGLKR